MADNYTCVDCGRKTAGSELSKGAVSAICPDCLQRRKEGKEPAHVRADAKKLAGKRQKPPEKPEELIV